MTVDVIVVINGTTKTRRYTAEHASAQILDGVGVITFTGGRDHKGPIVDVLHGHCEEIIRRPT